MCYSKVSWVTLGMRTLISSKKLILQDIIKSDFYNPTSLVGLHYFFLFFGQRYIFDYIFITVKLISNLNNKLSNNIVAFLSVTLWYFSILFTFCNNTSIFIYFFIILYKYFTNSSLLLQRHKFNSAKVYREGNRKRICSQDHRSQSGVPGWGRHTHYEGCHKAGDTHPQDGSWTPLY